MGLGCVKTRSEDSIEQIFLRVAISDTHVVERGRFLSVRGKSFSSFSIGRCFHTARVIFGLERGPARCLLGPDQRTPASTSFRSGKSPEAIANTSVLVELTDMTLGI